MERIGFLLRIKADKIEEYEEAHRHVWPELLADLTASGIHEYSIFRRGQDLFLTCHVPDWETADAFMAKSEANQRWQEFMAPLFEPVPGKRDDEPRVMMKEVFYMQGNSNGQSL